jgi:hypothetical protein
MLYSEHSTKIAANLCQAALVRQRHATIHAVI